MIAAPAPDFLGQDLEIELIRILAPHARARFFVDVGAEKGRFASAMFGCGMRGALFEPMARHFAALAELAMRHGSTAYPYAIDENDGEREFFIACGPDGTELDFFHSLQKLDNATQFHHSRSVRVRCRSLKSLAAEGALPGSIGILKTDTEGNDLAVLRGLGRIRPELVVCEYFTEGLYAGWKDARPRPAIELMRSLGYSRYVATKRVGEFEYCSGSPAGFLPAQWGNLFFIRDSLFADAESTLEDFFEDTEGRFIEAMRTVCADRVAKEAVIQDLLAR
jgi:FkbM family methyltransferase